LVEGDTTAPADLSEWALLLVGHVLEFDPALRGGRGNVRKQAARQS